MEESVFAADEIKMILLIKVEIVDVENRFFCSKDQSVIAIFYTSWYNQSIKGATATQGECMKIFL